MVRSEEELWGDVGGYLKRFVYVVLTIVLSYYILNSVVMYLTEIEKTKQSQIQLELKQVGVGVDTE